MKQWRALATVTVVLVTACATVAALPPTIAGASAPAPVVLDHEDDVGAAQQLVATGDVNGDGRADVVSSVDGQATAPFSIAVRLQQADGSLAPESDLTVASPPISLSVADLDGNGRSDIVFALPTGTAAAGVWASYQTLGGALSAPVRLVDRSGPSDGAIQQVEVRDMNGDSRLDLVLGSTGLPNALEAIQQVDHSFTVAALGGAGLSTGAIAVGDLNADSRPDVVWESGDLVEIQLQKADHTFLAPTSFVGNTTWADYPPHQIEITDLSGDGRPDLAFGPGPSPGVVVLNQQANGSFAYSALQPPYDGVDMGAFTLGDLNGDGLPDLIEHAGKVRVFTKTAGTGWDDTAVECGAGAVDRLPGGVTVGDVNGDGDPDVVMAMSTGIQICYGAAHNRGAVFGDFSGPSTSRDFGPAYPRTLVSGVTFPIPITDADGDTLTVTAPTPPAHGALGGAWPNVTYTPTAGYTGDETFTLQADDHHRRVVSRTYVLSIYPAASISGTVNDGYAPIPNATVDLYMDSESQPRLSVVTDGTGTFSFHDLGTGHSWYLHAHDPTGIHVDKWYNLSDERRDYMAIFLAAGEDYAVGSFVLPAASNQISVSTTADGPAGSLRDATVHVSPLGWLGPHTIELADHATYDLGCAGELQISGEVTIEGHGSTIRQTCPGSRVVHQMDNASLTLHDLTLTGGSVTGPSEGGGGIAGTGLILDGVTVTGNHAGGDGGGVASAGFLATASTISDNTAGGAGGGIQTGYATMTGSTVADNTAGGAGGGLSTGSATIDTSTFSGNTAGADGGAIAATEVTVPTAMVTATDSTAIDNHATGNGGAVRASDVTWTRGSLTSNSAHGNGGATAIGGAHPLEAVFDHASVSANTSDASGGASYGSTEVLTSTVSANHAMEGGALAGPTSTTFRAISSTLDGNVASLSGGAVALPHDGHIEIGVTTVTANDAPVASAIATDGSASVRMDASVVALSPSGPLCNGSYTANSVFSGSWMSDSSCGFASGPLVGAGDPHLGPMADNGGAMLTRMPLEGSPLIDALSSTDNACPLPGTVPSGVDQTDHERTRGMGCDPGSVEYRPVGSAFTPIDPVRVLDTRTGPVPAGRAVGDPLVGGTSLILQIAGVNGVPSDATAVVLNLTSTDATAAGFVTAWPAGEARPTTSSLNLQPGAAVPNLVTVKLGRTGAVRLYTDTGHVQLIADVFGYYAGSSSGLFTPTAPQRILDTRTAKVPAGRTPGAPLAGGTSLDQPVAGVGGIPSDVTAVVVNVTSTEATAAGFVTVWPTGAARPTTSNLNLQPGSDIANLVTVKVGAGGAISMFTDAGHVHLVADLVGYYRAGSGGLFFPVTPTRQIDTRDYPGLQLPGSHLPVQFGGFSVVDPEATAVEMNVTAVDSSDKGYVVLYPNDVSPPATSTLNYRPGSAVPNMAITRLGVLDRRILAWNPYGTTQLIMDVGGYFAPPS